MHGFGFQIDLNRTVFAKFTSNQLQNAETCQNVFTDFVTLRFHGKIVPQTTSLSGDICLQIFLSNHHGKSTE